MAITPKWDLDVVVTTSSNSWQASNVISLTGDTIHIGDLYLVAVIINSNVSVNSVTDSDGDTFSFIGSAEYSNTTPVQWCYLYWATASKSHGSSDSPSVTVSLSASARGSIQWADFSGVSAIGTSGTHIASSSSPQTSLTIQQAHAYVVNFIAIQGTPTISQKSGSGTLWQSDNSGVDSVAVVYNTSATVGTSLNMGCNLGTSEGFAMVAVELDPSVFSPSGSAQ